MAQLPDVFKHKDHDKMGDFTVMPAGTEVTAKIVKSEIVPTKAGDGKRLNMQAQIQDGEFKGKRLFIGLNIANPNPMAVEISQKELASICEVCGKATIKDTQELHDIAFGATVGIEKSEGYPDKNFIKSYKKLSGTGGTPNPFKPAA